MRNIKNKYIIVDIDGTIAKPGERLKYLEEEPKNWDLFYQNCITDEPIEHIIELVELLYKEGYTIVYCSGRRESCRKETIEWLHKYIPIVSSYELILRSQNDWRHDVIVKPKLLKKYNIPLEKIHLILEDRTSMVNQWRSMGLNCLQVAAGDF